MTRPEPKTPRPRGESAKGNFETAKNFAAASENARLMVEKKKSELLRQARLKRQAESTGEADC